MRLQSLFAVGVLVSCAVPAKAQWSAETAGAMEAYEKCATAMAQHYAPGSDAADLIAKAAAEACIPQMQAVAESLQRKGESITFMSSAIDQINIHLVRKLKLFVLEWRVKK